MEEVEEDSEHPELRMHSNSPPLEDEDEEEEDDDEVFEASSPPLDGNLIINLIIFKHNSIYDTCCYNCCIFMYVHVSTCIVKYMLYVRVHV